MNVIRNFDLIEYNSYRIKAKCSNAFLPNNEKELLKIFKDSSDDKKYLLGNGNNVILTKSFYHENFIIFNGCYDKIEIDGTEIIAEAGATTQHISNIALQHSLTGFEIFYDIPSSIGGAVVMNAGASSEEIKDVLVKVRYLDLDNMQIKEITNEEIGFEYRNSFFQKHTDKVVLKAWFRLTPGDPKNIKNKMENNKQKRWAKQPREYPNCGSVFKRPKGYYVGAIIEELGLKGYKLGGAMISDKHAGFIVNYGNATGEDILALIQLIKDEVLSKYNINLDMEQRII